jgi:F0F1-type ATP synthase membrane subunit a
MSAARSRTDQRCQSRHWLPFAHTIPVGSFALVVRGGMYLFGNPHAGRILFGVVVGLGLIVLAPSIVA